MKDIKISDALKKKQEMEGTIAVAIRKFSEETGLIVDGFEIDTTYARRIADGNLSISAVKILTSVRF